MTLRARTGAQVAYPKTVSALVRPVGGQWRSEAFQDLPAEASPDMLNCVVQQGQLRKRMGYAQYPVSHAAIGSAVCGLYSTQAADDTTHLLAVHPIGGAKYNATTDTWDALTGPALTGVASQQFSFANSQNSIVFSQGVDAVMRLPFTGTTYAALNAGAVPAKYLERFAGRLLLGHTVESATACPFRIRRPVRDDHTDWSGVGSGFRDCSEFPYHLKGLKKLGAGLAVYYEKAIEVATQTGVESAPMQYDVRIADIGLYLPRSLAGRNDLHVFIGTDNVYEFNGSQLTAIGDAIRDQLFATLNTSQLTQAFSQLLLDTQEYLAFVCTGSNTSPDTVWVYNWGRKVWYPWSVSGPSCATTHRLDNVTTIDELVGTFDEQGWIFDSSSAQQAYPALLTGHTDGKIYQWGSQYTSDNGAAIPCRWTSKDFTGQDLGVAGKKLTLKSLKIVYEDTGTPCTLSFYFSVNGGATWTSAQTVTLPPGEMGERTAAVYYQVTGDRIRWKFEHTSASETFRILAFCPEFELRSAPIYA